MGVFNFLGSGLPECSVLPNVCMIVCPPEGSCVNNLLICYCMTQCTDFPFVLTQSEKSDENIIKRGWACPARELGSGWWSPMAGGWWPSMASDLHLDSMYSRTCRSWTEVGAWSNWQKKQQPPAIYHPLWTPTRVHQWWRLSMNTSW